MGFKSIENDSGLMKEGEYEVYVKECMETETRNGKPVIAFDFVVRSDVDQAYKGKHVFKNFFQSNDTGEWPVEKIGKYANALGIEKDTEFELDELVGLNCILVIKHYTTNSGETKDCIFYAKRSKADAYIADIPGLSESADYDEDDGELPF